MDKIKKCPWCNARIHIDVKTCSFCKKKVGKTVAGGIAQKPIDWRSYLICLIVWVVFILYIWWAFFR
ncbi:MAG: hypothetical protein Q8P24_00030 [Desulfobacterales bacterium]|nr:hypothetical protein [Desulfobacterales bacterium]